MTPEPTPHEPRLLAEAIRSARLRAGMSQRELARQLSLSPGMISQVEKGSTQPSVTTLACMAQVLGVSLDSLFSITLRADELTAYPDESVGPDTDATQASAPGSHLSAFGPRERLAGLPSSSNFAIADLTARAGDRSIITMDSGVTWELLTPDQNHPLLFILVTYPVGAKTNTDGGFVRHTDFEYFYLLDGELTVQIQFQETVIRAGDSMWFDSTRPHNFENQGDTPARGVWCLLPHG